ncbi:uncharacterized protein LOC113505561 [Trichoplusia ni]|uniref:Uncharacterized protein LOC113505561 n=1 Tax=Trichoplusia ni TaxID=7111 RepID=A0A7E5WUB3_TRINI|nr:uncharacterized protein LOC113505561 [Trichoplusia ni]
MQCFLCEKSRNVIKFTDDRLEKCYRMLAYRKKKHFKYQDIILPKSLQYKGYHMLCYNRFLVLKRENRKEYESMIFGGPFFENYQEPDTSSSQDDQKHITMATTNTNKETAFINREDNNIPITDTFDNIQDYINTDISSSGILKSILTRKIPIKKDISIDRGHLWNHLNQTNLNPPRQY